MFNNHRNRDNRRENRHGRDRDDHHGDRHFRDNRDNRHIHDFRASRDHRDSPIRSPARNRYHNNNSNNNNHHNQAPTSGLAQHVRDLKRTISEYRGQVDALTTKVDDQQKTINRLVTMAEANFAPQWRMAANGSRSVNDVDTEGLLAIVEARRRNQRQDGEAGGLDAQPDAGREVAQPLPQPLPLPQPQPQPQPLPQPHLQPLPQRQLPQPQPPLPPVPEAEA